MGIVKAEKMTKVYPSGDGVWDIDLEVKKGQIFGFLGANGAGKTTTIRVLLGLLHPTSGKVRVLGEAPLKEKGIEKRREVGYLPGELALYEKHKGIDLLDFYAKSLDGNTPYREEVMKALSFSRKDLNKKIREYSRGMKQKLGLIIALQHKPQLVFMDEPTTGLDPLIQLEVYQLLKKYVDGGGTVFMSSHNLNEVEKVCNRVAIIRKGKIVALEDVEELVRRRVYSVQFSLSPEPAETDLQEIGLREVNIEHGLVNGKLTGDPDAFLRKLLEKGKVQDLSCSRGKLEDVFLEYYRPEEETK